MNNYFDINFSSLKIKNHLDKNLILNSDLSCINPISYKNFIVPEIRYDGKNILLHSKFDPYKESERFLAEVDFQNYELIIVFGFAYAYHLEIIAGKIRKDTVILIIEKNPAIIHSAFTNRDLTELLSNENILLMIDPSEDNIADLLKGRSSARTSFITQRASYQLYPDYYSNLSNIVKSYLSLKDVNIATLTKFEKIWTSNIARTVNIFVSNPGSNSFYGKLNFPAIVIGAGPSLNNSIDFIKNNSSKAILIAVDTAYNILTANGIEPHFCVCADPQIINARYFENMNKTNTILISDPTVHPAVYRFYKGQIAVCGMTFEMMKWIEDITGDKGEINHGGSVSTNAYDFAKRIGANKVYLVGQDLSFTNGLAHAKGSYIDEQMFLSINRFSNQETFNRRQLTYLPKILIKGIRSAVVHTNQKMMIFLSWFQKRNDPDLINLTVDGAFINGLTHLKINDIKLPEISTDIRNVITSIYNESVEKINLPETISSLINKIFEYTTELNEMIPLLKKSKTYSSELRKLIEVNSSDSNKINYLLKKLDDTDIFIDQKKNSKDIIGLTVQKVIHTIIEGQSIFEDNNSRLSIAKRSEYLYNGLYDGAVYTLNKLLVMKLMLEKNNQNDKI